MTKTMFVCVLMMVFILGYSQNKSRIQLRVPPEFAIPGSIVKLQVDSVEQFYSLGNDSVARFEIPALQSLAKVRVTLNSIGYSENSWQKSVHFIGSDTVLLELRQQEGGDSFMYKIDVMQYPLIELESAQSNLQVLIDGKPIGYTSTNTTLKPLVNHTVVWKNGSSKVCEKVVNLGYNEMKKFKCNDLGKVDEF